VQKRGNQIDKRSGGVPRVKRLRRRLREGGGRNRRTDAPDEVAGGQGGQAKWRMWGKDEINKIARSERVRVGNGNSLWKRKGIPFRGEGKGFLTGGRSYRTRVSGLEQQSQ